MLILKVFWEYESSKKIIFLCLGFRFRGNGFRSKYLPFPFPCEPRLPLIEIQNLHSVFSQIPIVLGVL